METNDKAILQWLQRGSCFSTASHTLQSETPLSFYLLQPGFFLRKQKTTENISSCSNLQ